jgi:hypothetical protein
MASELHNAGLDIAPAVGAAAATEFTAFTQLYAHLPSFEKILSGEGDDVEFPDEPSVRYALTIGLTARAVKAEPAYHVFKWLTEKAQPEWVQLSAIDLFKMMRAKGEWRALRAMIAQDAALQDWMAKYQDMKVMGNL